jgi:hypothetical protein
LTENGHVGYFLLVTERQYGRKGALPWRLVTYSKQLLRSIGWNNGNGSAATNPLGKQGPPALRVMAYY